MPNQYGEITDRGFGAALQRRFGVDPSLSLSLMPEAPFIISNTDFPELMFHQGWRRWHSAAAVSAVAAQAGRFSIRVPDAAQILTIVEEVWIGINAVTTSSFSVGFQSGYGPGNSDNATVVAGQWRDGRMKPQGTQMSVVSHTTSGVLVSTTNGFANICIGGSMQRLVGTPYILVPGNVLTWGVGTVNVDMYYVLVYRERALNDQENAP